MARLDLTEEEHSSQAVAWERCATKASWRRTGALQTTPGLQPVKVSSSGFILGMAKDSPSSGKIRASQVELPAEFL